MDTAHSILAPSSAARWVACAGSVLLEALYPEREPTQDSREGSATHWAASEMLAGRDVDVGLVAPNGVALTEEMIDAAQMYVDDIRATVGALGLMLHIEERVDIPSVHALNWGTPDCWAYDANTGTLHIWDFKFGHRFVDAFENWQLVDYVAGLFDTLGLDDQSTRVVMTIVQPRSYHRDGPVRRWSVIGSDLRALWNKLRNAAEAAMMTGAECTPNPECVDCKARFACEALQRDGYRSAQISTGSVPVELSPAALGLELDFLRAAADRLKGRITGLEEQARQQLMQGQRVPFFALVPVQGREKWAKPLDEVLALGSLFGKDLSKPREAITPNQARTAFKKAGLPVDVIDQYSARTSSLSLERDDGSQARKVFSIAQK